MSDPRPSAHRLFAILDWFIQPRKAHELPPDDVARARFLVGLLGLATLTAVFFAVHLLLVGGPWSNVVVCAVSALGYGAMLVWLRRSDDLRVVAATFAVVMSFAVAGSAFMGAGYRIAGSPWAIAAPMVITYLAGLRYGVFSAVSLAAAGLAMFFLESAGAWSPNPLAVQYLNAPSTTLPLWLISLAGLLLVSGLFEAAQRRSRHRLELSVRQLSSTQRQLIEASRAAGMAEVATTVLHNVGNVLTSVNVSAGLVSETVQGSKVASLARACELLREHRAGLGDFFRSDKGELLFSYLMRLPEVLADEQAMVSRELATLCKNIDHIKAIVATQQAHAVARGGVLERLSFAELVDEALGFGMTSPQHGIELERDYQEIPEVTVDRHRIFQIVVNLVSNAQHALTAADAAARRIALRLRRSGDRLQLAVADTGCGIAPENLSRIFNQGFTTRKNGHGFGLHASALAAAELGGSLRCHSDGPGRGATFTLDLPVLFHGAAADTQPHSDVA